MVHRNVRSMNTCLCMVKQVRMVGRQRGESRECEVRYQGLVLFNHAAPRRKSVLPISESLSFLLPTGSQASDISQLALQLYEAMG